MRPGMMHNLNVVERGGGLFVTESQRWLDLTEVRKDNQVSLRSDNFWDERGSSQNGRIHHKKWSSSRISLNLGRDSERAKQSAGRNFILTQHYLNN